jgi:FkbM family methyltransferase
MKLNLQQLRRTFDRYVREEGAAGVARAIPMASPVPDQAADRPSDRVQRLKSAIRRIPIVSAVAVTAYRIIKLPGRVALIVRQLNSLQDGQATVSQLHYRLDALSWHVAALQERLEPALRASEQAAHTVIDLQTASRDTRSQLDEAREHAKQASALARQTRDSVLALHQVMKGATAQQLLEILVALHEKSDRYQNEVRESLHRIKPIFHAGDNLIISRVGDLIMAFPAEEWRLPVYQILYGQLEPGLYKRMKDLLSDGMTVVDIGANVGTYTLLALQSVGGAGRVIAYEPTPRVFDILKNNVQINGFLESGVADLRRKAVSDGAADRASFYLSSNSLMNSLYGEDPASIRPVAVVDVECVSLDADLSDLDRVDVVKVDAEGAEPAILRGMMKLIARNPGITIFIEFAPKHLLRAGVEPSSFLTEIRRHGFAITEVVEPTGDTRDVDDDALCNCFSVNLMLRQQARR